MRRRSSLSIPTTDITTRKKGHTKSVVQFDLNLPLPGKKLKPEDKGPIIKESLKNQLSPTTPFEISDDISKKFASRVRIFFRTECKLELLTELVKLSNPWEHMPPDAISIFEACFFLLYGKIISTWTNMKLQLRYREDVFLDELGSFDQCSLITKSMNERDFRKIKSSIVNVDIHGMKKSKYYTLLRALRHWAISHIEFYEDWSREFESHIMKGVK